MTQQDETQQGAAPPEQAAAAGPQPALGPSPALSSPAGEPAAGSTSAGASLPAAAQPAADGLAAGGWQPPAAPPPPPPPPPAPSFPSPYLQDGMPQAYLAPPKPGQPRYGQGPARPGQGYGAPPRAQPAARGQQQAARPGPGARPRRDPAIAPPWQRLIAAVIDWFIIMAVSVIAFWAELAQVWRQIQAVTARYPQLNSPAEQAAVNAIMRNAANQHALLFWFLGMFGVALAYFWLQHAAWGATLGKRAFGIRVVRAGDRSPVGILPAGLRALAVLFGPVLFLLVISPVSVLGGIFWAADAGLPLLDPRAQALHDKIARTIVVRALPPGQHPQQSPW